MPHKSTRHLVWYSCHQSPLGSLPVCVLVSLWQSAGCMRNTR